MSSSSTPDWDARTYHRVSAPHQDWAEVLFDRLAPGQATQLRAITDRLTDQR